MRSNRIYINDGPLNQKIYEKPGLNRFLIEEDQEVPPQTTLLMEFTQTGNIDFHGMVNIDGSDISVTEPGMYTITTIYGLDQTTDPNNNGYSYAINISIFRRLPDGSQYEIIFARESNRIEPPHGQGNSRVFRTITGSTYLEPSDIILCTFSNNWLIDIPITILQDSTSLIISRIY